MGVGQRPLDHQTLQETEEKPARAVARRGGSALRPRKTSEEKPRMLEKILQKINLDLFRVYIKANNFITITKYTGYTPEIGSYDVLSNGIDQGIYPIPRIFSFGVNTSF